MTFITLYKDAIRDMWLRWTKGVDMDESGRGRTIRIRQALSRMKQLRRRPTPPETPEDYWYEVTEEKLADRARQGKQFKATPWRPGGPVYN